jgi:hypothetical protein
MRGFAVRSVVRLYRKITGTSSHQPNAAIQTQTSVLSCTHNDKRPQISLQAESELRMEESMIDANDLVGAFARNVMVVKMQAEGLTHEDSLRQLAYGNCLNWVLGHITVSRDDILTTLGEPPLFDTHGIRYKRGSLPLAADEAGTLRLEELLDWLDRAQERIAVALGSMGAAAFSHEIVLGDRKTTVGQRTFFLYFHESYHVGQTELFRQLAGKNDKII